MTATPTARPAAFRFRSTAPLGTTARRRAAAARGAAAVLAHGCGRGGRLTRLVTGAVAAVLAVRGLAGLGWAARLLESPPGPFHTLNLLLYTPACLGFGWAAARLARTR
ncbi:hypothetical protein AB0953_33255 [Streptomyces sp. NPDC046866]|uniref:hypothetical protein n=1 Tax=Streptomyces sp. NPDC046866 TaxID=3154921 RepID=UPI003454C65F